MTGDTLVLDSEWHLIFGCTHFDDLRLKLLVLGRTIGECRNYGIRGFATVANLVSLLKEVQTQYCLGVSLGSFIRHAISIRESRMSEKEGNKRKKKRRRKQYLLVDSYVEFQLAEA